MFSYNCKTVKYDIKLNLKHALTQILLNCVKWTYMYLYCLFAFVKHQSNKNVNKLFVFFLSRRQLGSSVQWETLVEGTKI